MNTPLRTLPTRTLRPLDLTEPLPCGSPFVSAASGLAVVDGHFIVAADDAHHLGLFACGSTARGRSLRILEGDLPENPGERKRRKPDFEALTVLPPTSAFPSGALLVVGSGSTANRNVAVLIEIDPAGRLTGQTHRRCLSDLYKPLRSQIGEVNIEGAFVLDGDLMLLSRANGSTPDNHVARYSLDGLSAWLSATESTPTVPSSVTQLRVGVIDGVPLGLTDGAPHPDGGWVFSAAAEDTDHSYNDGALAGAAVGIVDRHGEVTYLARIQPNVKVEGIIATVDAAVTTLTMVTDGDDPSTAASLLAATLPI